MDTDNKSTKEFFPLGVYSDNHKVFLYYNLRQKRNSIFCMDVSTDGYSFHKTETVPRIIERGKKLSTDKMQRFRISQAPSGYLLTYLKKDNKLFNQGIAKSTDLICWRKFGKNMPFR